MPRAELATRTKAEVQEYRNVGDVARRFQVIQELVKSVMKDGEDYGKVPGCGDKPTLLKPGAEKLLVLFQYEAEPVTKMEELGNGHCEYRVETIIRHIPSGKKIGRGVGSCSTMESKYRFRDAERKCPKCGKATIIKGKDEFGGGWICYAKKGGCGAKFKDGDKAIEGQDCGKVENPNIADARNTAWKIAAKRSLVDGILKTTGASAIFTQDIEDMQEMLAKTATIKPTVEVQAETVKDQPAEKQPTDLPMDIPEIPRMEIPDWRVVVCHVGSETRGKTLGKLVEGPDGWSDIERLFRGFHPKPKNAAGQFHKEDQELFWALRLALAEMNQDPTGMKGGAK